MDKSTEKILALLRIAIYKMPMLRVGQILTNAAKLAGWRNDDIFYAPDEVLLKGLEILTEEYKNESKT